MFMYWLSFFFLLLIMNTLGKYITHIMSCTYWGTNIVEGQLALWTLKSCQQTVLHAVDKKNQELKKALLSALHYSQLAFGPFFQGEKMYGIQAELLQPGFTKVDEGQQRWEGCGVLCVGKERIDMKIRLHVCLQVILWLWFEPALQGKKKQDLLTVLWCGHIFLRCYKKTLRSQMSLYVGTLVYFQWLISVISQLNVGIFYFRCGCRQKSNFS